MAKSKKELLAGRQKVGRPSLRREVVTNPDQEAAVVQKVADNPPPPPTALAAAVPLSEVEVPAKKPRRTKAKSTRSKQPTAKAKKAPSRVAKEQPASEEKEPFMRMTFDVPKSLHLRLKMHAIKNGVTIKAHMLRIIEESIDDWAIPEFGYTYDQTDRVGAKNSFPPFFIRYALNYTICRVEA